MTVKKRCMDHVRPPGRPRFIVVLSTLTTPVRIPLRWQLKFKDIKHLWRKHAHDSTDPRTGLSVYRDTDRTVCIFTDHWGQPQKNVALRDVYCEVNRIRVGQNEEVWPWLFRFQTDQIVIRETAAPQAGRL